MAIQFTKATKKRAKARIALDGPAGAGKTMSALRIARGLVGPTGKIAVIDTERGSASLYSDKVEFDVVELETFAPANYVEAIGAAVAAGYQVIVIDSLSHAWEGKGGALEMKDRAERAQRTPNSWTAWRDVTPAHNALVDAMLQCPAHVIVTMRSRMEHVQEKDEKTGRVVVRKVGMAPIQRPGMEYEFTLVGDIDTDHKLLVSKTRCDAFDNALIERPGEDFGRKMLAWLESGVDTPAPIPPASEVAPAAPPPQSAPAPGEVVGEPVRPQATPKGFADAIREAQTSDGLCAVGAAIAAAVSAKAISQSDREALLALYNLRAKALAAPAKAA